MDDVLLSEEAQCFEDLSCELSDGGQAFMLLLVG